MAPDFSNGFLYNGFDGLDCRSSPASGWVVQSIAGRGSGRFLDLFSDSRMYVDDVGEVGGSRTHLNGHDSFRDYFAGLRPNYVQAENHTGVLIGDQLHDAVSRAESQCPPVAGDRYGHHLRSFALRVGRGKTDGCNLGVREHDSWYRRWMEHCSVPTQSRNCHGRFGIAFVRECWTRRDLTDRRDVISNQPVRTNVEQSI